MFRHHPDGYIQIGNLLYPLAEFMLDEPNYSIPAGMIGRRYVPGDHHFLFDGTSQYGGDFPWQDGDQYLANEASYTANYNARLSSKGYFRAGADARGWPLGDYYEGPRGTTNDIQVGKRPGAEYDYNGTAWVANLERVRSTKLAALDAAYAGAIQQPVTYMNTSFDADSASQDTVNKVLAALAPSGAVPVGFYWVDANNAQIPMTLSDLQGLANAMFTQGWAAFQHLQDLKAQVRDATTVAQVEAVVW